MNCEEFVQKIDQAMAGQLNQSELDQFVAHKKACHPCSKKLAHRRIDLMEKRAKEGKVWIAMPWDPPFEQ